MASLRAGAASAAAVLLLALRPASAQQDLCLFNAGNSTFNLRPFTASGGGLWVGAPAQSPSLRPNAAALSSSRSSPTPPHPHAPLFLSTAATR